MSDIQRYWTDIENLSCNKQLFTIPREIVLFSDHKAKVQELEATIDAIVDDKWKDGKLKLGHLVAANNATKRNSIKADAIEEMLREVPVELGKVYVQNIKAYIELIREGGDETSRIRP